MPFIPTLNVWWLLATGLCFWFLCIHGPLHVAAKDYVEPLLYVHLVGAYSIYIVCAHNTLLTPSTLGGAARPWHVWVGRIGMALGIVGFVSGAVLTWGIYDGTNDLVFSIGITAGGVYQILCQLLGYQAIRSFQKTKEQIETGEYKGHEELCRLQDKQDGYLKSHIKNMINLFVLACGVPGWIRLAHATEPAVENGFAIFLPILIIAAIVISETMAGVYLRRMKAKRAAEREEFDRAVAVAESAEEEKGEDNQIMEPVEEVRSDSDPEFDGC